MKARIILIFSVQLESHISIRNLCQVNKCCFMWPDTMNMTDLHIMGFEKCEPGHLSMWILMALNGEMTADTDSKQEQ